MRTLFIFFKVIWSIDPYDSKTITFWDFIYKKRLGFKSSWAMAKDIATILKEKTDNGFDEEQIYH